eukprot:SAG31_NODE_7713_length_1610_cov_1.979484_3_plen_131_part_00
MLSVASLDFAAGCVLTFYSAGMERTADQPTEDPLQANLIVKKVRTLPPEYPSVGFPSKAAILARSASTPVAVGLVGGSGGSGSGSCASGAGAGAKTGEAERDGGEPLRLRRRRSSRSRISSLDGKCSIIS